MRPTFFGIEIARSGLTVSQKGLDVTGHNVSNVDTAGYTRQRLVNTAIDPINSTVRFKPVERALVGHGATIMILDQIRQGHLDRQYRTEANYLADWNTRTQGLTYVEALFEGSDATSFTGVLQGLFDGFNEMTKEANDLAQRSTVINEANKLVDQFNHIYNRLIEQQQSEELAVNATVTKINRLADQIVELNNSIYKFERGDIPQPANDLRDKRNLLLDELSTLVDITYEETEDRHFHVYVGGHEMINHKEVDYMTVKSEPLPIDSEDPTVTYKRSVPGFGDPNATPPTFKALVFGPNNIKGGELKAHVELRDNRDSDRPGIPYFIEQINTLARAIVKTVNAQHKKGWTRPVSETEPSLTGQLFFEEVAGDTNYAKVTAGNIKLVDQLLDKNTGAYYLAASSNKIEAYLDPSATTKQAGNQENALELFRIYDLTNITMGSISGKDINVGKLSDYAGTIVFSVASALSESKQRQNVATDLVLSADNSRQSVSGVSLDEEMTNLIRYQHAFTGASRVLTTMDDALDILINRMGRVGL